MKTTKILNGAKKWWVLALVLTLALSLTSCSKSKKDTQDGNFGYSRCLGTLGDFDVFVIPRKGSPGLHDFIVIPVQPVEEGALIRIAIANNQLDIVEKVTQASAVSNQEINGGTITDTDLENYDIVAMTAWKQGNPPFINNNGDPNAVCKLPIPGGDIAESAE